MKTSTDRLRPFSEFTPDAVRTMLESHTIVALASMTGESPTLIMNAKEGKVKYGIGHIIRFLQNRLVSETFLSHYAVTDKDFSMNGLRNKKVSLDYYVWRKIVGEAERNKLFPNLVASLKQAEAEKQAERVSKRRDEDDDSPMELVAFLGSGKDQGIRWMTRAKLERLQSTSPDAKYKIITDQSPSWLLQMFKDIEKDHFVVPTQMALPLERGEKETA